MEKESGPNDKLAPSSLQPRNKGRDRGGEAPNARQIVLESACLRLFYFPGIAGLQKLLQIARAFLGDDLTHLGVDDVFVAR
jgi:hypothetical protein